MSVPISRRQALVTGAAGLSLLGTSCKMDPSSAEPRRSEPPRGDSPSRVRSFAPPHTGSNYLLREMAYEIGRKHARRLQIISLTFGFALPVILLLLPFSHWIALLAVISHISGVLAARWLFFAQAEHVVGLYYGKR